jgi:diacylglycerol kinase family enzyme
MLERVRIVMNERSGSCMGRATEIQSTFAAHGIPSTIAPMRSGSSMKETIRAAAAEPGTIVVAAGGDGTVNCVASALADRAPMGVLPLGTLNHFAKDLGMPPTLPEAVAAIVSAKPRDVDLGSVNGRVFVNNSSLGFYPGMVLQRERLKKVGLNKWLSLLIASASAFIRFRHITVTVTVARTADSDVPQTLIRSTPFLFVGNNEYVMEGPEAGTRKRLDGARLYLYMAPGATRLSILGLTLAALRRRVSEAQHFEALCVEEFTVQVTRRGKHRHLRVALDGEIHRMRSPLHYCVRPQALQVLAPEPGA